MTGFRLPSKPLAISGFTALVNAASRTADYDGLVYNACVSLVQNTGQTPTLVCVSRDVYEHTNVSVFVSNGRPAIRVHAFGWLEVHVIDDDPYDHISSFDLTDLPYAPPRARPREYVTAHGEYVP